MLECDVPQMDLGNYEARIFGLRFRQAVWFTVAALLIGILVYFFHDKGVEWFLPWIAVIIAPTWYFSSVYPCGMKPEKFLLVCFRYYFLVPKTRPNMSSLQHAERRALMDAAQDKRREKADNKGKAQKKEKKPSMRDMATLTEKAKQEEDVRVSRSKEEEKIKETAKENVLRQKEDSKRTETQKPAVEKKPEAVKNVPFSNNKRQLDVFDGK